MSTSTDSRRIVLCGGARGRHRSAKSTLVLNTHGKSANVALKVGDINERMARNLPDVLVDLLELATYIFAADQATGRGTPRDERDTWHRRFRIEVAVRCPQVWKQEAVQSALVDVVSFLSDDDFEFGFSKLDRSPDRQLYFDAVSP